MKNMFLVLISLLFDKWKVSVHRWFWIWFSFSRTILLQNQKWRRITTVHLFLEFETYGNNSMILLIKINRLNHLITQNNIIYTYLLWNSLILIYFIHIFSNKFTYSVLASEKTSLTDGELMTKHKLHMTKLNGKLVT